MPDWYKEVQAAKYAGITLGAWEAMPLYYRSRYIGAMNAENEAERELRRFREAREKRAR